MSNYPNIALVGGSGAGKDTVGQILFEEYGYTQVALADQLRTIAALNPTWQALVDEHGYEHAKRTVPYTRQYLIDLGQTIRDGDENYFINALDQKLIVGTPPFVVTDVRQQNETEYLAWEIDAYTPFKYLRINRPGVEYDGPNLDTLALPYLVIDNNRTIADLKQSIEVIFTVTQWASY